MKPNVRSLAGIFAVLLSAAGLFAVGCNPQESPISPADLVLQGGSVYTVDASRSRAQSVAVTGGRIVFVGSNEDVEAYIGDDTRVVDLQGRMVLPAFQDTHIHPIGGGMDALAIDLNELETIEDYVEAIRRYAEDNPDETWLLGSGWLMSAFGPGARASRRLIDAVVPDRPVFLTSSDGHTGWANSKALELAGVDGSTSDPVDGRIDRDPETGEAVGSLQEGAMNLVEAHIPPPDLEKRLAGLRYSLDMLNAYGITAIQDAHVDREWLETYREMNQREELSVRVIGSIWWDRHRGMEQLEEIKQLREEFTAGNIRATTVKIMQDGVMENFTAAMLEPYIGQGENKGIPMIEPAALKEIVAAIDAEGFQLHFHAIGDAAIRQSLDAVELARQRNGDLGHRHHIAHLELIDPEDIPRFGRLDVIANFQPLWAYADRYITNLTLPYLDEARRRWLYPIESVHAGGAQIVFSSDWSVTTANPFEIMETAIARMGARGQTDTPFIPEERVDLPTALEAYTINAAYVNGLENISGSIEAGKAADLIVLDRNLFEIPVTEISDTRVLLTLMDGKPVYGDPADL